MKKYLIMLFVIGISCGVLAGGHHRVYRDRRNYYIYHRHHDRNNGLVLAAGIVNIVGNGLRILTPPPTIKTVIQPVAQPVIVQQSIPTQHVVIQEQQPVIIQNQNKVTPQYIYVKTEKGLVRYKLD